MKRLYGSARLGGTRTVQQERSARMAAQQQRAPQDPVAAWATAWAHQRCSLNEVPRGIRAEVKALVKGRFA